MGVKTDLYVDSVYLRGNLIAKDPILAISYSVVHLPF